MADVLRIKRRSSGNPGAPASLAYAELAYNEVDDILYYGRGNNAGQAVTIIPIAGPGFIGTGGGGSGNASIVVSDTPPASPTDNMLWFESDTGALWLRFNDGNTTQWITISVPPGPTMGFLPLTGGVITGDLTISNNAIVNGLFSVAPTAANANLILNKPTGAYANYIQGQRNGVLRWTITLGDGTAESSGNVGSWFSITRWNDAGSVIDSPLTINRATGDIALSQTLTIGSKLAVGGKTIPSDALAQTMFCDQYAGAAGLSLSSNCYWASGWKYYTTNYASLISMGVGQFQVWTAVSGTAGTAVPITLRIDISSDGETLFYPNLNKSLNVVPAGSTAPTVNAAIRVAYGGGGLQYGIGFRPAADNTYPLYFTNAANTGVGSVNVSTTTTTYNTTSDARLKEDLQDFDAGSIIDNIKVYDFAWKTTGERAHGIIAQEAIEVYPEAVTHTDDEQMEWWGIDYSKYVPLLLQEIKSLRERVSALEGRAV